VLTTRRKSCRNIQITFIVHVDVDANSVFASLPRHTVNVEEAGIAEQTIWRFELTATPGTCIPDALTIRTKQCVEKPTFIYRATSALRTNLHRVLLIVTVSSIPGRCRKKISIVIKHDNGTSTCVTNGRITFR